MNTNAHFNPHSTVSHLHTMKAMVRTEVCIECFLIKVRGDSRPNDALISRQDLGSLCFVRGPEPKDSVENLKGPEPNHFDQQGVITG